MKTETCHRTRGEFLACRRYSIRTGQALARDPAEQEKLEHHAKMAAGRLASLQAIKAALDPLYASFSDEQKKLADGLKIGPIGVM
jgi:hypothetical protein